MIFEAAVEDIESQKNIDGIPKFPIAKKMLDLSDDLLCHILSYDWNSFGCFFISCRDTYNRISAADNFFLKECCTSIRSIGFPCTEAHLFRKQCPGFIRSICFPEMGPSEDDFYYTMPGEVENPCTWREVLFTGLRKYNFIRKQYSNALWIQDECERILEENAKKYALEESLENPENEERKVEHENFNSKNFSKCPLKFVFIHKTDYSKRNEALLTDEELECLLTLWPSETLSLVQNQISLIKYAPVPSEGIVSRTESDDIIALYEFHVESESSEVRKGDVTIALNKILNSMDISCLDVCSHLQVSIQTMRLEMPYEVYFCTILG